jgi:hypothetical protein
VDFQNKTARSWKNDDIVMGVFSGQLCVLLLEDLAELYLRVFKQFIHIKFEVCMMSECSEVFSAVPYVHGSFFDTLL